MKRYVKYSIRFIMLFLMILTNCFFPDNVFAQDPLNGQDKIIPMETVWEIVLNNECVEHEYECKNEKEATCDNEGFRILHCLNCSYSYKETIPAAHKYTLTVIEATCIEKGYTLYSCINCNHSYRDDYTPVGAHQYVSHIKKEATYQENGIMEYRCIYCDDFYEKIIPAVGHSYDNGTVVEATCTEEGYTLYTCVNCKRSYKDDYTPVRAHQYVSHIKKEAACKEEGIREYRCIYCDDSYEKPIPAVGHNYQETVIAATCTEEGYTLYTCINCNHSYKDDYTPVRAHQYVSQIKKEAACEEEGIREYRCIYCEDSYDETIPALGHAYGDWFIEKEATPTEEGYRCKVCSNNPNHIIRVAIPYTYVIEETEEETDTSESISESEDSSEVEDTAEESGSEAPAEVVPEESIPTESDKSAPSAAINAMDAVLTALIALSSAGFATTIIGDVRVLNWDRKLRNKHKK